MFSLFSVLFFIYILEYDTISVWTSRSLTPTESISSPTPSMSSPTREYSSLYHHHSKAKQKVQKKIDKEASVEVCGGAKVVKIVAGKDIQDATKGFRSKQAWHLGQWSLHSALREAPVDGKYCKRGGSAAAVMCWPVDHSFLKFSFVFLIADAYVHTLMPIFMEQDLYCLATSMGSK